MNGYRKHVFVCENRRDDGACCALGAAGLAAADGGCVKYMRQLLHAVKQHGKGRVRINRAGCFDRCQEGPVLVIYPEARWYRYRSTDDLREIVTCDILADTPVTRLLI